MVTTIAFSTVLKVVFFTGLISFFLGIFCGHVIATPSKSKSIKKPDEKPERKF
jgi:hypothetical protein